MVLSPIRAKPPVPEVFAEALRFASRRKMPMEAMRNEPLARSAMVARLRVRRRAAARTARPERVNPSPLIPLPIGWGEGEDGAFSDARTLVLRATRASQAAAAPRPAMSNNEPALKKTSGLLVSSAVTAQMTVAMAGTPAPIAIHLPQLRTLDFGLWASPASNSRAGRFACLRKAKPITMVETATLAERPVLSVAGDA